MGDIARSLLQRIRSIVRGCFSTSEQQDTTGYNYVSQVEAMGLSTFAAVLYPYGYAASAPEGSHGVLFNLNAQPENQFAVLYDPNTRFIGLKPGEVIVGNQETATFIKFSDDGNVDITSTAELTINCNNATINCMSGSGDLTIDAATTTITGDLVVQGDITATNVTATNDVADSGGTLQANRNTYNIHTHQESGGGTTNAPNQPQ